VITEYIVRYSAKQSKLTQACGGHVTLPVNIEHQQLVTVVAAADAKLEQCYSQGLELLSTTPQYRQLYSSTV
jgi:hypothetical protein